MLQTGINLKLIGMSGLFASIVILGIIMHGFGSPYHVLIFNVHKLLSLGFVVLYYIFLKGYIPSSLGGNLILLAIILFIFFIEGQMITRGLMSKVKVPKNVFVTIYIISTLGALVSITPMIYFSFNQ